MLLACHKFDAPAELKAHCLPDMVFIHGTGSGGLMWTRQVEHFAARGHRCYVLDLRGHGDSAEPGEWTDLEVHLKDVTETLESSDIKFPAIFVGHSLGSILSISLCERRPEWFQQIFAAALPGRVLKPMTHAFNWALKHSFPRLRNTAWHEKMAWREKTLLNTPVHTLEQIVANFAELNFLDREINVKCPLHFSVGRFDPVAPCLFVERIHKTVPGSTLKIFEWSGHNFMDLQYESFSQWIEDRLEPVGDLSESKKK